MFHQFIPAWGIEVFPEVGGQVSGEDVEDRRLPNGVLPEEAHHPPLPGHRKPIEGELVGAVAVDVVRLQFIGEVDDAQGSERAFPHADTAATTDELRHVGLTRIVEPDGLPPRAHHGAESDAD